LRKKLRKNTFHRKNWIQISRTKKRICKTSYMRYKIYGKYRYEIKYRSKNYA
jgi:hypothetical protein